MLVFKLAEPKIDSGDWSSRRVHNCTYHRHQLPDSVFQVGQSLPIAILSGKSVCRRGRVRGEGEERRGRGEARERRGEGEERRGRGEGEASRERQRRGWGWVREKWGWGRWRGYSESYQIEGEAGVRAWTSEGEVGEDRGRGSSESKKILFLTSSMPLWSIIGRPCSRCL